MHGVSTCLPLKRPVKRLRARDHASAARVAQTGTMSPTHIVVDSLDKGSSSHHHYLISRFVTLPSASSDVSWEGYFSQTLAPQLAASTTTSLRLSRIIMSLSNDEAVEPESLRDRVGTYSAMNLTRIAFQLVPSATLPPPSPPPPPRLIAGLSQASPRAKWRLRSAQACDAYYDRWLPKGHCRCLPPTVNVSRDLDSALALQEPQTRTLRRDRTVPSHGGVAILLRGQPFRGEEPGARREAQLRCSWSVAQVIVNPLVQRGHRVGVFLTIATGSNSAEHHDTAENEPIEPIYEPYAEHVVAVTLAKAGSGTTQLTTMANALSAFITHCEDAHDEYDLVIATRLDLRFKPFDIVALLGLEHGLRWEGIRFLWREIFGGWRSRWPVANTSALAYFDPARWKSQMRVPDTFHVITSRFLSCFRKALLQEMTRWWEREPSHLVFHTDLHLTSIRLAEALSVKEVTIASDSISKKDSVVGFLLSDGAYDSNGGGQCRYGEKGGACQPNPIYDMWPRHQWMEAFCQRPEEFVYDPLSQSRCCPSPTYCCPNSVTDCTADAVQAILGRRRRV